MRFCEVETNELENVRVFPNPAEGLFQVESGMTNSDVDLQVINLSGNVLLEESFKYSTGRTSNQIDMRGFKRGVYFLRFSNDEKSLVKKILLI